MIRILISDRLGERRWKQRDLVRKSGVDKNVVNEYFNEWTDRVNLEYLNAICDALECKLTDVLWREEDGPAPLRKDGVLPKQPRGKNKDR